MPQRKPQKQGKKKTKTHKNQSSSDASDSFIGTYDDAPTFSKDNQHIFSGYRINYDTPKKIFKTLFMVHNESVIVYINPYVATQNGEQITFNEKVGEHLKYFENLTFIK
jgi:hypothetical protein